MKINSFANYLQKVWKGSSVLISCNDMRQIKGKITEVRADYVLVVVKGKKRAIGIQMNKIILVEEWVEEGAA